MKKFILGLGTVATTVAPVAAVISCGDDSTPTTPVNLGTNSVSGSTVKGAFDASSTATLGDVSNVEVDQANNKAKFSVEVTADGTLVVGAGGVATNVVAGDKVEFTVTNFQTGTMEVKIKDQAPVPIVSPALFGEIEHAVEAAMPQPAPGSPDGGQHPTGPIALSGFSISGSTIVPTFSSHTAMLGDITVVTPDEATRSLTFDVKVITGGTIVVNSGGATQNVATGDTIHFAIPTEGNGPELNVTIGGTTVTMQNPALVAAVTSAIASANPSLFPGGMPGSSGPGATVMPTDAEIQTMVDNFGSKYINAHKTTERYNQIFATAQTNKTMEQLGFEISKFNGKPPILNMLDNLGKTYEVLFDGAATPASDSNIQLTLKVKFDGKEWTNANPLQVSTATYNDAVTDQGDLDAIVEATHFHHNPISSIKPADFRTLLTTPKTLTAAELGIDRHGLYHENEIGFVPFDCDLKFDASAYANGDVHVIPFIQKKSDHTILRRFSEILVTPATVVDGTAAASTVTGSYHYVAVGADSPFQKIRQLKEAAAKPAGITIAELETAAGIDTGLSATDKTAFKIKFTFTDLVWGAPDIATQTLAIKFELVGPDAIIVVENGTGIMQIIGS